MRRLSHLHVIFSSRNSPSPGFSAIPNSLEVCCVERADLRFCLVCSLPLVYLYPHSKYSLSFTWTQTYVGQTDDLSERLKLHNEGRVRSTKGFGPWQVLYCEEHETRGEAMRREKWFKSRSGRRRIKRLLQERWPSGPASCFTGRPRSRPAVGGTEEGANSRSTKY